MSSQTQPQPTVAQSKRYTLNYLGNNPEQYALTIDNALTVTFIKNAPNALVIDTIETHDNAIAKHSDGLFLLMADTITIPDGAIEILEAGTGMRFEGSQTIPNPFPTDTENPSQPTLTASDAMK